MDVVVLKLLGTRCLWEPQGVENGSPQALDEPGMKVGVSSLALSEWQEYGEPRGFYGRLRCGPI